MVMYNNNRTIGLYFAEGWGIMRYKILLTGRDEEAKEEYFFELKDYYGVITSSCIDEDLLAHINYFRPDIIMVCLGNLTQDDYTSFIETDKAINREDRIPIVIIGTPEEAGEFKEETNSIQRLVINSSFPIFAIKSQLDTFIKKVSKKSDDMLGLGTKPLIRRKILVIDGKVAFNGGINLGDEYINRIEKYGHWKDTAIMLTGHAVKSFTLMFLQMWNITETSHDDFKKYILIEEKQEDSYGYIMPYGDSPLDNENVGENVYMDILATAKKYVHIMTPYLIIDNEMITALTYAAKRGVDVKIILPHIPDKKYAFMLARTYYLELIEAGVKIYEYIPGFVHAKVFSCDDEKAVVGTINLDFRSLYLHFECATFIYKAPVIKDIEDDYNETLKKCKKITLEDYKNLNVFYKIGGGILKLFAPLM